MPLHELPDFTDPNLPEHLQVPRLILQWERELEEAVLALALSPKEKIIAAATVEDEISCLEVQQGEERWRLAGHSGGVNRVAFLGGNTLASVGEDGKCRIWNIAKKSCTHELAVEEEGADR